MVNPLPKRLLLACLLPLLAAAASAVPSAPPMSLRASGGADGTVQLSWDAPLDAGSAPIAYNLYANGDLAAVVQATTYTVPLGAPTLYAVTAVQAGHESAPAFLLVGGLRRDVDWPVHAAGLACPPLGTNVYTYWPFVAVEVYDECLPLQP